MDNGIKTGTAGGTLLTIIVNIKGEDILKTMILATVGAVISFAVSLLLKVLMKKWKQ